MSFEQIAKNIMEDTLDRYRNSIPRKAVIKMVEDIIKVYKAGKEEIHGEQE